MNQQILRQHTTLSIPQQHDLLKDYITTKNVNSRNAIVQANYRLIISLARGFNRGGDEFLLKDLISEGLTAAYTCLDRFQLNRGDCTVVSWIKTSVIRALNEYVSNNKIVSVNISARKRMALEYELVNLFYVKNGYYPAVGQTLTEVINGQEQTLIVKNLYGSIDVHDIENIDYDSPDNDESLEDVDVNLFYKLINTDALTQREQLMLDWVYYKNNSPADLRFYLLPQDSNEIKSLYKSGKNIININGSELNVFYFLNKHKNKHTSSIVYNNQINDYYTNKNEFSIKSEKELSVIYDGKIITPILKNNIYLYKITLNNKGFILTAQSMYNLHDMLLDNLRMSLLKNKIKK